MYRLAQRIDNLSLRLLDVGVVGTAWLLALLAGYESRSPSGVEPAALVAFIAIPVVIQLVANQTMGLYGPVWRYASLDEALRVGGSVAAGAVASTAVLLGFTAALGVTFPLLTAPPLAVLLVLLGCGGVRFQARLFALERHQTKKPDHARALIVGTGAAGAHLAHELRHSETGRQLQIVGFADDDLVGRSVRGLPVLGHTFELDELCETHAIDQLLIPISERAEGTSKELLERALQTRAKVKVLQSVSDRVGAPLVGGVRDLDLTDLLSREHAPVDSDEIAQYLEGGTVLITGAGGSIGSEIARQVAQYEPARVLLLDRDETLLHEVAVGPLAGAEPVLLDIRDKRRVWRLFERQQPDVVFHAAANKHVPILERHPAEAVRTNVLGTWWLALAAAEHGCRRFVHISTDKAADPCSVMGATKRAAEQIVFEVGRTYGLPFVAVRFGNVLGSRGSVVPTFMRQILDGGPVTITSPDMTRFFMTIPEAVSLVLQSGAMANECRLLLLDMGNAVRIIDLARQMIRMAGLRPDKDVVLDITGSRPGERLHERLNDEAEVIEASEHPSISTLAPKSPWTWIELIDAVTELDESCEKADDETVSGLLGKMLRSRGVDCHLTTQLPGLTVDLRDAAGEGEGEESEEEEVVSTTALLRDREGRRSEMIDLRRLGLDAHSL